MDARETNDVLIQRYILLLSMMVLYYDYCLTLTIEINSVWSKPFSKASALFYANRYIPLIGDVVVLYYSFASFTSEKACSRFGAFRDALIVVNQVVVCLVVILRTCALYGNSRKIRLFFVVLSVAIAAVVGWSVAYGGSTIIDVPTCALSITKKSATALAVAWEAQAALDLIIFVLTAWKSFQMLRERRQDDWHFGNITDVIVRDGAIYFGSIMLINIANLFTYYFASNILRGMLSSFASCLSITLVSRLLLNLKTYHAVTGDTLYSEDAESQPSNPFPRVARRVRAGPALTVTFVEEVTTEVSFSTRGAQIVAEEYEMDRVTPSHRLAFPPGTCTDLSEP